MPEASVWRRISEDIRAPRNTERKIRKSTRKTQKNFCGFHFAFFAVLLRLLRSAFVLGLLPRVPLRHRPRHVARGEVERPHGVVLPAHDLHEDAAAQRVLPG